MPDHPGDWPGHAVLQVPVVSLEPFVRERTAHHDPGFLGRLGVPGEPHVHAHVTVLGPFDLPPDAGVVARLAAGTHRFTTRFTTVATFGNGIIHAVPDDPSPFRQLTERARRAFPGVVPYRGEFAVEPHVTLDALADDVTEQWVRRRVSGLLGRPEPVTRLDLVWYRSGDTRLLGRWPLAGAGA